MAIPKLTIKGSNWEHSAEGWHLCDTTCEIEEAWSYSKFSYPNEIYFATSQLVVPPDGQFPTNWQDNPDIDPPSAFTSFPFPFHTRETLMKRNFYKNEGDLERKHPIGFLHKEAIEMYWRIKKFSNMVSVEASDEKDLMLPYAFFRDCYVGGEEIGVLIDFSKTYFTFLPNLDPSIPFVIDKVYPHIECCREPWCCVFPADGLGDTYQENDLLDKVAINWFKHYEGVADKNGSEYTAGAIKLKRNEAGTAWVLEDSSDPDKLVRRTVGRCLLLGDGRLKEGDDLVEDQLEASYTVGAWWVYQAPPTQGPPPDYEIIKTPPETRGGEYVCERVDLCTWRYVLLREEANEGQFIEYWLTLSFNPTKQKWTVFHNLAAWVNHTKDSEQNTPVGSYTNENPPENSSITGVLVYVY
jgi:hypothetical protein